MPEEVGPFPSLSCVKLNLSSVSLSLSLSLSLYLILSQISVLNYTIFLFSFKTFI